MTEIPLPTDARHLGAPLYAMAREGDGSWKRIGGPFEDVDDLLDCCFNHMMDVRVITSDHDLTSRDVAFIETIDGQEVQQAFPHGALPEDED